MNKKNIPKIIKKEATSGVRRNENPSEVTDAYWLIAQRIEGEYPSPTTNSGKWLVFVSSEGIDQVWAKIKNATIKGLLGSASKAATAKTNPNAINKSMKVICVYTYDYTDIDDVKRIRQELRKIGIIDKIPYKTDKATREKLYQVNGQKRISVYFE